jgi:hypothetical protein
MRITITTMTALAVAAAVTGFSVAAKAEVLEKTTFKGNSAFAIFEQETPITCADGSAGTITSEIEVAGNEFSSRSRQLPNTANNTVEVFSSMFNSCTQAGFFNDTVIDNALTQNGLQSATMSGGVNVVDSDGNVIGDAVFNLTFAGTGATSSSQSHGRFVFESPDGPITSTSHFKGTSRDATVTGSVTLLGVEMIGDLVFADLSQTKNGTSELLK